LFEGVERTVLQPVWASHGHHGHAIRKPPIDGLEIHMIERLLQQHGRNGLNEIPSVISPCLADTRFGVFSSSPPSPITRVSDRLTQKFVLFRFGLEMGVQTFFSRPETKKSTNFCRQAIAHLVMGLGGEDEKDTKARIAEHGEITDGDSFKPLRPCLLQRGVQSYESPGHRWAACEWHVVMAMAAHTGCNTVYGSTPSKQSSPYPWMNSLFPGRHHRGMAAG